MYVLSSMLIYVCVGCFVVKLTVLSIGCLQLCDNNCFLPAGYCYASFYACVLSFPRMFVTNLCSVYAIFGC